jgi:hypothetical protein
LERFDLERDDGLVEFDNEIVAGRIYATASTRCSAMGGAALSLSSGKCARHALRPELTRGPGGQQS